MLVNTNVQLIQKRTEVEQKDGTKKRYTNFILRVPMGNRYVDVPIKPVDFGEQSNRKNYTLLINVADKLEQSNQKQESPF